MSYYKLLQLRIFMVFYRACLYIFLESLREEDFKFIFLFF